MRNFIGVHLVTVALLLHVSCSSAFNNFIQKQNVAGHNLNRVVLSYSQDEEDSFVSMKPDTSFGAEVVPEGQRPVNEYLDLLKAPLFGWASEEVGTSGLLTRVAILYAAVFAVV